MRIRTGNKDKIWPWEVWGSQRHWRSHRMHDANTASARALENFLGYQYRVITIDFFFSFKNSTTALWRKKTQQAVKMTTEKFVTFCPLKATRSLSKHTIQKSGFLCTLRIFFFKVVSSKRRCEFSHMSNKNNDPAQTQARQGVLNDPLRGKTRGS